MWRGQAPGPWPPSALAPTRLGAPPRDGTLTEKHSFLLTHVHGTLIAGVPGRAPLTMRDGPQTFQRLWKRGPLKFTVNFEINVLPGQVKRPAGTGTPGWCEEDPGEPENVQEEEMSVPRVRLPRNTRLSSCGAEEMLTLLGGLGAPGAGGAVWEGALWGVGPGDRPRPGQRGFPEQPPPPGDAFLLAWPGGL